MLLQGPHSQHQATYWKFSKHIFVHLLPPENRLQYLVTFNLLFKFSPPITLDRKKKVGRSYLIEHTRCLLSQFPWQLGYHSVILCQRQSATLTMKLEEVIHHGQPHWPLWPYHQLSVGRQYCQNCNAMSSSNNTSVPPCQFCAMVLALVPGFIIPQSCSIAFSGLCKKFILK